MEDRAQEKIGEGSTPAAAPPSDIESAGDDHGSLPETISSQPLGPALKRRVSSVDALRGVAVLGILAMNIYGFAMPFQAYNNPLNWGGEGAFSLAIWFATHLVFDQKFMPVFSMLFGAGLVLMWQRAAGRPTAGVWYRRQIWLLVIGAAHGYLLWFGDILFTYAVMGMLIYPLRRARPRTLVAIGAVLFILGLPLSTLMGFHSEKMAGLAEGLSARLADGEELSGEDAQKLEEWKGMRPMMAPTAQDIAEDVEIYRGSYGQIVAHRAPMTLMMQTGGLLFVGIWRMGALMLIGMALMKLKIFSAERDDRFYWRLMAAGYGIGVPLVMVSAYVLASHRWDPFVFQQYGVHWNAVGGVAMALGHIAAVMLICRRNVLPSLRRRFEAVGRMALSNYLLHSIVLTTVFYGYGLGLYGHIERPVQMLFVAGLWALQLWWSPIWLEKMRFGPVEWLWRSLTYGKLQPLRRT